MWLVKPYVHVDEIQTFIYIESFNCGASWAHSVFAYFSFLKRIKTTSRPASVYHTAIYLCACWMKICLLVKICAQMNRCRPPTLHRLCTLKIPESIKSKQNTIKASNNECLIERSCPILAIHMEKHTHYSHAFRIIVLLIADRKVVSLCLSIYKLRRTKR